ncbi:MAG: 1,4-dihydroxy-2-naphthoate polyprenyltransferase [Candidatus Kapaibacteriota bacterium]
MIQNKNVIDMNSNKIKAILHSTRPKTLSASLAPVIIGSSIAAKFQKFDFSIFLVIAICAIFIQIITNFINEIYDFKKGADNPLRLGPTRSVSSGLISVKTMSIISIILIILTFLLGLILVNYSNYYILIVGILSLLFAWAYTGGPYPLAYNGLAEPMVFIFFGIIAVNGTIYVFTKEITEIGLITSCMPGFLSTTLLMVNNIRDIPTDELVGKNTLAVKLGKEQSRHLYFLLHFIVMFIPVFLAINQQSYIYLLPLLSLPLNIRAAITIYYKEGSELNKILALNGLLIIINGILTSISFLLDN